ncbi:ROK family protein, partial [Actinoplanes missouriensis]|uniref:ROK family protein n=1 Tax=Actinoplanes missouriensis TaxID=1866 RepID=UPI0033CE3129
MTPIGRRIHLVRRDLIFAAVREAGRISRADLVRRTGMARVTVNSLVTDLLAAGVLTEEAAAPTGDRAGRPARSLTLGPAAGGVVGAVIGADGVRVAEADLAGRILREHHHDIDTSDPSTALDAIAEVITGTGRVWSTVAGLSAPISGGVVQSSSVLPGWAGIAPATELSRRLGHRVIVRNDADLCLLGEVEYGVAAGHRDVCYLRVNSGIGCGLLLGGVVHHGATGVAGEIGHVQVDETGALCHCGNRGCLETIASPRQILGALSGSYGSPVTAAHAVELARSDATAERVMADAGRMIGRVVAALANGINPSLVVLDGPLIEPGGPVVLGVVESLHRYAQPEVVENTEVRVSALGGRAALLGSLAVALRGTPVARGSRALPESAPGGAAPGGAAPGGAAPGGAAPGGAAPGGAA